MYKHLITFFKVMLKRDKYLKKEKADKKNWCKHSSCMLMPFKLYNFK